MAFVRLLSTSLLFWFKEVSPKAKKTKVHKGSVVQQKCHISFKMQMLAEQHNKGKTQIAISTHTARVCEWLMMMVVKPGLSAATTVCFTVLSLLASSHAGSQSELSSGAESDEKSNARREVVRLRVSVRVSVCERV